MVVLAFGFGSLARVHPRMQDGWIVHLYDGRSCCSMGSLGNLGYQARVYHGEYSMFN